MNFFHNLYIVFPRLSCKGGVFYYNINSVEKKLIFAENCRQICRFQDVSYLY